MKKRLFEGVKFEIEGDKGKKGGKSIPVAESKPLTHPQAKVIGKRRLKVASAPKAQGKTIKIIKQRGKPDRVEVQEPVPEIIGGSLPSTRKERRDRVRSSKPIGAKMPRISNRFKKLT